MKKTTIYLMSVLVMVAIYSTVLFGQTTEFVYQGQLQNASAPANGSYDFEFLLFDALSGGTQIGSTLPKSGVSVVNGIFSVKLDFGANFPGAQRFLEIHVVQTGGGAFTTLTPRQPVTSTPYSVKSLNTDNATNATNAVTANGLSASCVGCVSNAQIGTLDGAKVTGTVANATNATTATNANQLGGIAASGYLQTNGNGSGLTNLNANNVATGTLANARLGLIPTENIADNAVTAPKIASGQAVKSLNALTDGVTLAAGSNITITPSGNTLTIASTGNGGGSAILNQTTQQAGANFNISGNGTIGGNLIASGIVGIGTATPNTELHLRSASTTGFAIQMENTSTAKRLYIGNYGTVGGGIHWPGFDSANTSFLYAENTLVFTTPGGIHFSGSTTAEHMTISPNGNVGIGTTSPVNGKLHVVTTNSGLASVYGRNDGGGATFSAEGVRGVGSIGVHGESSGGISGGYGVYGTGYNAGVYGYGDIAGVRGESPLSYGGYFVGKGYFSDNVGIGTSQPNSKLEVIGNVRFSSGLFLPGTLGGGTTTLCLNSLFAVSTCGSSLRYKTNIGHFNAGLDLLKKLKPITFDWKEGGMHDLGLGAEDVEKIEPLLVTHNKDGQVEGVKYDRIGVVLINAVKEQQEQIETQAKQINEQHRDIEQLIAANGALGRRLHVVERRLRPKHINGSKR